MKVLILYRRQSEQARKVEEFIHDFGRWHPEASIEVQDVDSREGMAIATLYDVLGHPAVLALKEDGQLVQCWQGDNLPLMDEIAYYSNA